MEGFTFERKTTDLWIKRFFRALGLFGKVALEDLLIRCWQLDINLVVKNSSCKWFLINRLQVWWVNTVFYSVNTSPWTLGRWLRVDDSLHSTWRIPVFPVNRSFHGGWFLVILSLESLWLRLLISSRSHRSCPLALRHRTFPSHRSPQTLESSDADSTWLLLLQSLLYPRS